MVSGTRCSAMVSSARCSAMVSGTHCSAMVSGTHCSAQLIWKSSGVSAGQWLKGANILWVTEVNLHLSVEMLDTPKLGYETA